MGCIRVYIDWDSSLFDLIKGIKKRYLMKRIKEKCYNNSLFICVLLLAASFMIIYISIASSNVPIMDYWKYINALVEKSYTGGVSFADLYSNNGMHRSPFQLFIFLINVKVFHYNTQIAMYLGVVVSMINCIVFYKVIKRISSNEKIANVMGILGVFFFFSLGAYELIAQEFALALQIRVFSFLILYIYTDKLLKAWGETYDKRTSCLALYYLLVIDIFGGAFAISLSITVMMILLFDAIYKKIKGNRINIFNYIVLYISLFLGDFLYLYGLQVGGTVSASVGISELIRSFFEGLFLAGGSSLFGTYNSHTVLMVLGMIVICCHIICIVLYISKKGYEKTYLPVFLYIYTFGFYCMIFLGRSGNGLDYLTSSRYIIDSLFAILADILVLTCVLSQCNRKKKYSIALGSIMILFFLVGIMKTDYEEVKRAPYRKQYDDNLIQIMLHIDDYTDDELNLFQANSPEMVRSGVDIMKKYHLGVFYGR